MARSLPPPSVDVSLRHTVPGIYEAYAWKNIAILVWFSSFTFESLPVFEKGIRERFAQHPEGVSTVNLVMVPGGQAPPSSELRSAFMNLLQKHASNSAAVSVVLPGSGFWASALRGLVTGLFALARRRVPVRIFASCAEVANWLPPLHEAETGTTVSPAELLAALNWVEAVGRRAARAA